MPTTLLHNPPGFLDLPKALPSFVGAVAHDSPLQILIDEDFLLIKTLYIFVTNIANKLNCRLEAFMKKIREYNVRFDSMYLYCIIQNYEKSYIFTV